MIESIVDRRNELVEAHLYLVRPIAARLALGLPRSFDLEDLTATGYLGLIQAAGRYRPRSHGGTPFSAYARPRIRGYILDSLRRGNYIESTRPSVEDLPESISSFPAEETIDDGRLAMRMGSALRALPAREREVIELHYAEEQRLPEVGRAFGVGKSRASQLHRSAIKALRARLAG